MSTTSNIVTVLPIAVLWCLDVTGALILRTKEEEGKEWNDSANSEQVDRPSGERCARGIFCSLQTDAAAIHKVSGKPIVSDVDGHVGVLARVLFLREMTIFCAP